MKRYDLKIKQQITDQYHQGVSPSVLCKKYHIPESTLFYWLKQYPSGKSSSTSSKRFSDLPKIISHARKVEAELEFLQRTIIKDYSLREKMKIVDKEYGRESLRVQCDALNLNRSSYLNHQRRNKNENTWFKVREAELSKNILDIFEHSGHIYGSAKIAAIMQKDGKTVSTDYVRKIMRKLGLRSKRSSSDKDYRIFSRHNRSEKHSSKDFKPTSFNQVWASDTSSVFVHNRPYFICAYLDLYSRRIVGMNVGPSNSTYLAKRTLLEAYKNRNNPDGLTIHTDNGSCYSSYSFNLFLKENRIIHSYSRPKTPHDNSIMESFFNTLKRECIFLTGYPKSLRELKIMVVKFMEWYNMERPHENLKYSTPDRYEKASRVTALNTQ